MCCNKLHDIAFADKTNLPHDKNKCMYSMQMVDNTVREYYWNHFAIYFLWNFIMISGHKVKYI